MKVGKGKIIYADGSSYVGQFTDDAVDGKAMMQYQDKLKSSFKFLSYIHPNGYNQNGMFLKGKLTNKCQIDFANGDQFVGMFRGGNPNGYG